MKSNKQRLVIISVLLLFVSYFVSVTIVRIMNVESPEIIILIVIMVTVFIGVIITINRDDNIISLQKELEEQTNIRSSILKLTQNMTMIHSNTELYDMILQTAVDVLPNATMGSLMILKEDNCLDFTSVVGFELDELQAIRLPLKESYLYNETKGILDRTVIVDNAQVVNASISGDLNKEIANTTNTDLINTTITSPLYIDNKLYGMMNIDSQTVHAFSESDVDLMNFFGNEVVKVIKLYETIEENNRLSKFDPLTNLYNRRYLHHRLKKMTNESNLFTLVSIDINNLKEVNDKYGHDLGDELLMKFVTVLNKSLSKTDLFSRYGGDEFIIVYDDKSKETVEKQYVDYLLPFFENEIVHEDIKDIRVSFSYGITSYPEDATNYEQLMIKADQLMYTSKRAFHMKKSLKD